MVGEFARCSSSLSCVFSDILSKMDERQSCFAIGVLRAGVGCCTRKCVGSLGWNIGYNVAGPVKLILR